MDGNKDLQNVTEKPKKKKPQAHQAKREGKKKSGDSQRPAMSSTVQYHPESSIQYQADRLMPEGQGTHHFTDRLVPDGQALNQPRLHNLPPKKSLSPSFIASHVLSLAQEGMNQPSEPSHTVQHLPTSPSKGQSSTERIADIRFMGQIFPQPSQYRAFTPHGLEQGGLRAPHGLEQGGLRLPHGFDQGGLLRQQLLHGIRPSSDSSFHRPTIDPSRSSPSYHRVDPPRSSPSYHSPPPNRTVHNIPGSSPPGISGRVSESERMSPYHVSTIRKTPSPAPKRVSPGPQKSTPSPKHQRMSPVPELSSHYRQDRVSPAERTQLSLEEAIKLMQGHPGASVPQHLLTQVSLGHQVQLTQQPSRPETEDITKVCNLIHRLLRPETEDITKTKEMIHKPERSTKQFISTMLANQAKSRQPTPGSVFPPHSLTVDTHSDHHQMSQFVKVSPSGPRLVSPPGLVPRQMVPSGGMTRQMSPSGGMQQQMSPPGGVPRQTGGQMYHSTTPSIVHPTSLPQTAQMTTALLQPQVMTSAGTAIRRIPSPKPQHRHKDFAQAQARNTLQNIHIPENAGPIRQPVVELVKIPIPRSTDGSIQTFSASQMTSLTTHAGNLTHLPFSQIQPHSFGENMATEINKTSQGMINPFTFPTNPSVISQPKSQPRYEVISPVVQPVIEQKRKLSDIEMPHLDPVPSLQKQASPVKVEMVKMRNPFNMRLQNLSNLPTNSMYRSTYRAHSMAVHRAKAGLITSTAKTLDLLRQNLQKFINKEIDVIVKEYLDKFFKPGIENIKSNNGENSVTDEHVQAVCRQILEEAKKMYTTEQRSTTPVRDENTPIPLNRKRNASDTDSEKSVPFQPRKKKGRPPIYSSGRSTPSKPAKANEPVKREGPKWDSNRLDSNTQYIMGARANKALGLGATRGRIYIKHPDVFKYCGDQDDKQWLYENHKMPATGGKAYMMLLEDVKDLAEDDEYRNNANVMMDEIVGFCIPDWMTEKVKVQMESLRTDKAKQRSRSTTPNEGQLGIQDGSDVYKEDLPFSAFSTAKRSPHKEEIQTSPGDTEMEFLTGGDNEDHNNLSPFNLTGGFDEGISPSASDLDTLDEAPLSAPFDFTK
ncbi:DNTTIP1 [Mytilus coruscus]|uniref:DNTTIP1 n=1 Tax=Mytilus coruscus TaxID=42192 RepID=A0A6J8CXZ9_MYTCO|nr:DNTTIP1 [Mytilus coruscus]